MSNKIVKYVHFPSISPYLKMEVIASRISGCADIADHLALFYPLSGRYADCGTMRIKRLKRIAVSDFYVISIPAAP